MADEIPISGLPPLTNALLTDLYPTVQVGVTYQGTLQQIYDLFVTELPVIPSIPVPLNQGGLGASLSAVNNAVFSTDGSGNSQLSATLPAGLSIPDYLGLSGGTMLGPINMGGFAITNLLDPVNPQDAATRGYVLSTIGNYLPLTGGTLTGGLSLSSSQPSGLDLTINNSSTAAGAYSRLLLQTLQTSGSDPYITFLLGGSPNVPFSIGLDSTDDSFKMTRGFALGTADFSINTSTGVVSFGSPLSLSSGGTNANLTASNGGIFYSTSSAAAILSGTATAGQILRSGSNAAPSWSTTTYPSTNAINTLLYASAANQMAALATANNAALITNGSGAPSLTALGNLKVLGTNASGTVAGRSISLNVVTFTASSTYTSSTGCIGYFYEMVGGGGGGGGTGATGVSTFAAAAGGGGGEYVYGFSNTPASSVTVTIGAAGAGGTAGANNGSAGGNTALGSVTANGGSGGGGRAAVAGSSTVGALGGTGGTGGSLRFPGQPGGTGNQVASGSLCSGGFGGSSRLGAGGVGSVASVGAVGLGYGAGGSGASAGVTSSANAGGNGTAGVVLITEVILN